MYSIFIKSCLSINMMRQTRHTHLPVFLEFSLNAIIFPLHWTHMTLSRCLLLASVTVATSYKDGGRSQPKAKIDQGHS